MIDESKTLSGAGKVVPVEEISAAELIEGIGVGVAICDLKLKILQANNTTSEMFGYKLEDVVERPVYNFIAKEEKRKLPKILQEISTKGRIENIELIAVAKGGKRFLCSVNATLLKNKMGESKQAIIVFRDISEQKKTEEELRNSYLELQGNKDELIRSEKLAFTGRIAASIAHEIRNPLTNVSMSLQQLSKGFKPSHPHTKHIDIVKRNLERVNYLITELLNCARPSKLKLVEFDIHKVIRDVLDNAKPKIKSQKIEVIRRFTTKPSIIKIDKAHIERVFLNLIINAIEAMPKGGKLSIITELNAQYLLVKIQDTGKGIAEKDVIRIFDPFFSTKAGGVGLGLTICYGIIVSHAGTVEVESKARKGSVFTVSLPIEQRLTHMGGGEIKTRDNSH